MNAFGANQRRHGGFALSELLVTIVVLGIGLATIYSFFFSGLLSARTTESHGLAARSGQVAIERIARDVRQARSPDGILSAISALSATSVTFYVDTNRVAGSAFSPTKVRYSLTSGTLTREVQLPTATTPSVVFATPGVWSSPVTVASGFENTALEPVFSAFGVVPDTSSSAVGPLIAAPVSASALATIASINIRFFIGQTTGDKHTRTEIATDVLLRNRVLI